MIKITYKNVFKSRKHKRVPLNLDEAENLKKISEKDEVDKLIVNVLLDTGLRLSEFQGLIPSQVLSKENVIEIRDIRFGEEGSRGKGEKYRRVPMSRKVREILEEWFKKYDRIPISTRTIERRVKKLGKKAGITKKVSPHILRHTFAITFIHKGGSIVALKEILGHDSIQTTEIYLNYSSELVQQEFERVWD